MLNRNLTLSETIVPVSSAFVTFAAFAFYPSG
jgi:hypothetical protein